MGEAFVAAIDWGTSALRAWLLDEGGAVLAESRGDDGITRVPPGGFADVLTRHLARLGAPEALPVLIAGMAGARQGWVEAPYLDVPRGLADLAGGAVLVSFEGHDVRILPGMAQRPPLPADVMRGEETQLLGLGIADGLVCIPGTHSKWITLKSGTVTGFATHMTGELFEVMARHSILQHSAAEGAADGPGFDAGVTLTLIDRVPVTQALFSTRARGLVAKDRGDGRAYLSGLLIGAEVAAMKPEGRPVNLLASGGLADLYDRVLAMAGIETVRADAEAASRAGLFTAAKGIWG